MDDLLDIASVAEYLGVSERTVYNKVRSGELPAFKVGRLWRVRRRDLEGWIGERQQAGPGRAFSGPIDVSGASLAADGGLMPSRADLERLLKPLVDQIERRLAFVGLLSLVCEALRWPAPVVVGGHAVEFWTAGGYSTVDIDLVGASEPIGQTLESWGFSRQGRHWYDDTLGLVVEAPGARLSASERERVVEVSVQGVVARVLGLDDLIIDRLNACVHWKNEESCDVARALVLGGGDHIDLEYLRERAVEENVSEALARILAEVDPS